MVCKNRDIYGCLRPSWVLITMASRNRPKVLPRARPIPAGEPAARSRLAGQVNSNVRPQILV